MPNEIKSMIMQVYPKRDPWVHKGDLGYVFILAGSKKHSGSPIFNAMGALRSGSDCVFVRGHERAMNITANYAPDIITEPFADEFAMHDIDAALHDMEKCQSAIVGCGMERTGISFDAIRALVSRSTTPLVLDAEAIRAVAEQKEILKGKNIILTPNSEEFRVLTGETLGTNESERTERAKELAAKLGVTILLKGNVDIITDGTRVYVNKTGSPFMTKGGFGDVLSGITGSVLARTKDPYVSACVGAYIAGTAGESVANRFGEGVLASDMFETIPMVIRAMTSAKWHG